MASKAAMRVVLALGLCLAAAAVSAWLLAQHHGEPWAVSAVNQACGDGQTSGCEDVARSTWSRFAGLPLAAWGLGFYLSLSLALALGVLAPVEVRGTLAGLALAGLALGLLADLVLLGVQAFAIGAYCGLCIATYLLGAAALVALLPFRGALRHALATDGRPDARLALAAWALGTVALAGTALAADAALGARAGQRQASLLGAPAPAPAQTPAPEPAAAPAEASAATPFPPGEAPGERDAGYWEKRARDLQATLDDPQRLDAYFAEKARREYETAEAVSIDLEGVPVKGPADAPVRIVEYSDFLCPFCRNIGVALSQFVGQAGGRVAVYFKHYPLDAACNPAVTRSLHPGACTLALGAICAHNQGRFDAYHDRVFSTELRAPRPADVARLAAEAGLDGAALESCLDDPKTKAALAAQVAEANRLGVSATPTLYVNGRKLPRFNDLVPVVDREARKKGFAPLGP
jgi:protein-disulfide isomerase/uncharacterized membrane protein